MHWEGIIRHYARFFSPVPEECVVTLLEGNTPLVPAAALARRIAPGTEIFLKYEGLNPTGSFKDRGMTMAVSRAKADGSNAVICASTGNTSASAAAYAARAGMKAFVLIPEGKIALGKLSQAMIHGAQVLQVLGNFDDALTLVKEVSEKYPVTLVNSINPYRIQGQKSAAFEIVDALGDAPDYHVLPVGNAGNITAYWAGYKEYRASGAAKSLPAMLGWQAEGAAPIVRGAPVKKPETVATAIRIGNPASWKQAESARDESGGFIRMVSDAEILDAYKMVAETEGIFCEPASAASIAGVVKLARENFFRRGQRLVCTLTGHGLKDPDNAIAQSVSPATIPPTMADVLRVLGF
ncbi:MAG: threonine synthase [Deltaproteobacteria bacterium]|nr:MAG: threonine synthase [Deltaproteobacteria bacterium]